MFHHRSCAGEEQSGAALDQPTNKQHTVHVLLLRPALTEPQMCMMQE